MGDRQLEIESPILITGCARSGTSMVSGIINICGAWGGKLSGPTRFNRRGMFENGQIRNGIVKPFLSSIGCDPMGQHPLPDIDKIRAVAFSGNFATEWRDQVLNVIGGQQYRGGPWFYKGAKMCLMWPLWHVAFPRANWIIVRRADEDIVYSCMRTSFMRAHQTENGWHDWVNAHRQRFDEMKATRLRWREIWPQRIVNGDFEEMKSIVRHLGLRWNEQKVIEFVTPALWSSGAIRKKVRRAN